MTDVTWANTWHQHLTGQAAGNPLAVAVLDLHKPDERGDCSGCDSDGWEAEQPDYPCGTVELIAASFGFVLAADCSVCRGRRPALITGGPVGHHQLEGAMWVSCPGSTEVVEAMPWRSEAEVMTEMADGLGAAAGYMDSALTVTRPIPDAVQLSAVRKWGQQAHIAESLFRR